ncbi:MauE/DoxX family redox-associated membrane protein [Pedobacter sp. SYP-B3415]|uniref:MauE/DoxX family redox-associated membrane protein n=1 Tax=Pedobacter sp. SYP-B3415 TaxID=2496641 RepID=UPI00101BE862|nr:MauE/DoxX family redox-associated membrane protein [Pedobacter sp. SYP-B3415]
MKIPDQVRPALVQISCALLVFLWLYTAGSKLSDLEEFKRSLSGQAMPDMAKTILYGALIPAEISAALLLLIPATKMLGFRVSMIFLSLFTAYILFILFKAEEARPCSCGGVLKQLNWNTHLLFNLACMSICALGIWINKGRRQQDT